MTNPRFHAFEAKRNLPFYSTGSLAIGSIIVACCAIIMALSPLLLPAFLPVALVGLVLAILGLFSYQDRSALQVAAMSINGLLVLFALLKGPSGMLQPANAAEYAVWPQANLLSGSSDVLPGWLLQRDQTSSSDGIGMDFVVQWDVSGIEGHWNWFEGTLYVQNARTGAEHELTWEIHGPIHSGVIVMQGHSLSISESEMELAWLLSSPIEDLVIGFRPIQWEHSAPDQHQFARSASNLPTVSRRYARDIGGMQ
jgi:hypothetical protein